MRLLVLERWKKDISQVDESKKTKELLQGEDKAYQGVLNHLFQTNDIVRIAKEPVYDIPTALDVFLTGGYSRLPEVLRLEEQKDKFGKYVPMVVDRLTDHIRMTILSETIPSGLKIIKIENGQILLRCEQEYEILMTITHQDYQHVLGGDGQLKEVKNPMFFWRIIDLDLLVNEKGQPKSKMNMNGRLVQILQARLRSRVSKVPFVDIHEKVHGICVNLAFSILEKQARMIASGPLNGVATVNFESNVLIVQYWKKNVDEKVPTIYISLMGNQVVVVHENPSIDRANAQIDLSAIDFTSLVKLFIGNNIVTQLREIQKCITVETELIVKSDGESSQLKVPLVNDNFCAISINWKDDSIEMAHQLDSYLSGEWKRTIASPLGFLETIQEVKNWCLLKYFEKAACLMKLDCSFGKDEQNNDCLYFPYPKFPSFFVCIGISGAKSLFRIQYRKNVAIEAQELSWSGDLTRVGLKVFKSQIETYISTRPVQVLEIALSIGMNVAGLRPKRVNGGFQFEIHSKAAGTRVFELGVASPPSWRVACDKATSYQFTPKGRGNGHVHYESNGSISFVYETEPFTRFLDDLNAVDAISALAVEAEKAQLPTTVLTHTFIAFKCTSGAQVEIKYRRGRIVVVLNPTHELAPFLSDFLNKTKSLSQFVTLLNEISVPMVFLKQYPWTIIPRELKEARIYYKDRAYGIQFGTELILVDGKNIIKKGNDYQKVISEFWGYIILASIFGFIKENLVKMELKFVEANSTIAIKTDPEIMFEESDGKIKISGRDLKPIDCARLNQLFLEMNTTQKTGSFLALLRCSASTIRQILLELFDGADDKSRIRPKLLFSAPSDLTLPTALSNNISMDRQDVIDTQTMFYSSGEFTFIMRYQDQSRILDFPFYYKEKDHGVAMSLPTLWTTYLMRMASKSFDAIPSSQDKLRKCLELVSTNPFNFFQTPE